MAIRLALEIAFGREGLLNFAIPLGSGRRLDGSSRSMGRLSVLGGRTRFGFGLGLLGVRECGSACQSEQGYDGSEEVMYPQPFIVPPNLACDVKLGRTCRGARFSVPRRHSWRRLLRWTIGSLRRGSPARLAPIGFLLSERFAGPA